MSKNKRIIKAYYIANKEVSDYKKTMEEAFIKYLRFNNKINYLWFTRYEYKTLIVKIDDYLWHNNT